MIEFSQVTAVVSAGVALYSILRVEQVRRAGTDEGLRQKVQEDVAAIYKKMEDMGSILQKRIDLEGSILREKQEIDRLKLAILEVQVQPFVDSYRKRVADTFHNPHPSSWRLDRLIEEYQREQDRMPPQRLQAIIDEMWIIYQQAGKDGSNPDPFMFFNARVWLDILDVQRDTWHLMRAHEARVRELEARQVTLEEERQQLGHERLPDASSEEQRRWWTCWLAWLRKFLHGSR